jgi:MFS family permease
MLRLLFASQELAYGDCMFSLAFLRSNARLIGFGFALCFMASAGQTYFISSFGGEIRTAFGLSHGDFGTVYAVGTLGSAATLVWLGRIVDTMSVARTVILTLVVLALVSVFMGFTWGAASLAVAVYGLRLMGQGMAMHIGVTAMARFFVAERGRALSIASLGGAVGAALSPLYIVALLTVVGWREAWWITAALVLLSLPLSLLLIRGENLGARAKEIASSQAEQGGAQYKVGDVIRDPGMWLRMPVLLAPSFISTGFVFHQVHVAQAKGWSIDLMAGSFTAYAVASVVGLMISGPLVDRFSAKQLMPIYLVPLALCCLALFYGGDPVWAPVYMALMGAGTGLSAVVRGALWAELYGIAHVGAIRSFSTALMVFSSGMAPAVMGIALDFGFLIEGIALTCAIYCVFATFVGRLAKPPRPLEA